MTAMQLRRIRWAVRAALVLGIVASITANVLHAQPNLVARTIAGWPPAALLITLELIARVPVHRRALTAARLVAAGVIASIAAWVSYWHMAAVAARYGEATDAAHLIPLSVDGLIVVASVCLVELADRIRAETSTPAKAAGEPPNPVSAERDLPAQTLGESGSGEQGDELREIAHLDPIAERATRRAAALASLAEPDADPAAIAAAAEVTVGTLHRWVDEAASKARRPRGGRPKNAIAAESTTSRRTTSVRTE